MTDSPELCRHHWVIASPTGGEFSPGRCKLCGEERQFRNSKGAYQDTYTPHSEIMKGMKNDPLGPARLNRAYKE